jgi:hypothetical protein
VLEISQPEKKNIADDVNMAMVAFSWLESLVA